MKHAIYRIILFRRQFQVDGECIDSVTKVVVQLTFTFPLGPFGSMLKRIWNSRYSIHFGHVIIIELHTVITTVQNAIACILKILCLMSKITVLTNPKSNT